ncbi:MAG TPA: 16S rRNA (guanine(527)-N(7))-methyltransferase RsmG [Dehalococcoidia bacterium]|nr:16S rRNA (guanine(527)-N(7))-methyltransferase RsmG [Dehalococcoidia bacterium]
MSTTPSSLEFLRSEAFRLGLQLDDVALDRFERYLTLLLEWRERAGLTSISDPLTIQQRHFVESVALLVALRGGGLLHDEGGKIADLGTGAGFPGLPMRIVDPTLQLTLIESSSRRCRFLETVVDALHLDGVAVIQARAEEAGHDPVLRAGFDLVVARALAALPILVEYALPLLREGGILAAPKGSRGASELEAAAGAIAALGGQAEGSLALPLSEDVPPQRVYMVRRVGRLDERFPRRPGVPSRRPLR